MENFQQEIKKNNKMKDKKKILIADDNRMNADITKQILKIHNYEVDIVSNGREVLSNLHNKVYDLILMDVQMPILDGIETTKIIRHFEDENNLKHIPIVAFTAHALDGDKERFLAAGMNEYVSKPFQIQNLYAVVERLLKRGGI